MFEILSGAVLVIGILVLVLRQINQYEGGVMFTMGKFVGVKQPGWRVNEALKHMAADQRGETQN